MNIKDLFTENRGVSPVIGVILMVAITVILAAVIGAFVLGIGGDIDTAPQASFEITDTDTEENQIELRHRGGDTIEWDDTNLIVENASDSETVRWDGPDAGSFSAGDRATINTSGDRELTSGGEPISASEGDFTFNTGDRITVTLIDRSSGEIIFDRDVRA